VDEVYDVVAQHVKPAQQTLFTGARSRRAQQARDEFGTAGALRLSRTPAASSAPDGLNVNRARARGTLRAGAAPHLAVAAFLC
jgi:hypothetical protein